MKNKMKIKLNDRVLVLTGKDRGKTGTVSQVLPERNMVVVDGVNKTIKHMKTNQKDQKGQRIEFFGPIHASNVMLVDEETGKPGRVGYQVTQGEDGKTIKTRIVKTSQQRKAVKKEEKKEEKVEKKSAAPAKAAQAKKAAKKSATKATTK